MRFFLSNVAPSLVMKCIQVSSILEQEIVETQTVDENGAVVTVQTIRDGNWVEVTEQRPPVRKPHGVRIENVVQPRNKKPLPVTAPHTNIIPNMQRLQSGQTSIIAHNSENQPVSHSNEVDNRR